MTTDRAVFSEVFPSAGTRTRISVTDAVAWFRLVSLVEPRLVSKGSCQDLGGQNQQREFP